VVKANVRPTEPVRASQRERARGAGRGGGADLADGPARHDHDHLHWSGAGGSVRAMTPRSYLRGRFSPTKDAECRRVRS